MEIDEWENHWQLLKEGYSGDTKDVLLKFIMQYIKPHGENTVTSDICDYISNHEQHFHDIED